MIWSGTLIYWANDVYKISAGTFQFQFYPDSVYKSLKIPHRLAEGMSYHFLFMWLFFLNGFLYTLYLIFSGEWRDLLPSRKSFKDSLLVVLHDLHLTKKKPEFKKYNGAQRIAYTAIIIMGFLSLLSGLAIYKPAAFSGLVTFLGGYENSRLIHFVLTIGFLLFFIVHIIQVILAGWNNFRAMITGWEVLKVEESSVVEPKFESNLSDLPIDKLKSDSNLSNEE